SIPANPPLATWQQIPATGLSTGNGWATWASMRKSGVAEDTECRAVPYTADFALRLLVRSPAPFALVSNMEWIIDGTITSFQQEPDTLQATMIADLIRPIWPHWA